MHQGEQIFDDLRTRFAARIGAAELAVLETQLATLVGDSPIRLEAPGWAAHTL